MIANEIDGLPFGRSLSFIQLLASYGVTGAEAELEKAVNEVAGHALALNLLGNYVGRLFKGDIRKRDTIPALSKEREEGKHAEKVMAAYETHLKGTTALSILYMMGLFDRPVSTAAIKHLRNAKIPQLTDQLSDEAEWQYALDDLRQQQLLNSNDPNHPDTLDTHPLIREYFGKQLKYTAPKAWQQAHRLLYDYYKDLPEKQQPDTLEEMQPLFAAIAHGCAAGMHQQAIYDVYYHRIQRDNKINYLCNKLGAFGSDLSTLSHFFSQHWHTPAAELTDADKAVVLNWAAFRLQALGRLQEAVQPMQADVELAIKQEDWKGAAQADNNLSELQLTRGAVADAITAAQQSLELADKSGDTFCRMASHTTLADAQHQAGERAKAQELFEKAESLQKESQAELQQLYGATGFKYRNLVLTQGNYKDVKQQAEYSLKLSIEYLGKGFGLHDIALDQLSLGQASLQHAIEIHVGSIKRSATDQTYHSTGGFALAKEYHVFSPLIRDKNHAIELKTSQPRLSLQNAENWLNQAVDGLRKAGYEYYLPLGLLARASYNRHTLNIVARMEPAEYGEQITDPKHSTLSEKNPHSAKLHAGYDVALQDLQEVHDIVQRGGMLLHLCDYHLESARLALTIDEPVHELTAKQHTQKAKQLIDDTGYKRRLPEVEYLENYITTDKHK